nr:T-cell receptor alpha chain [Gadus morhua]
MQLFMSLVLFTGFAGKSHQQTIHSMQDRVQALQGDNVTLSCNYTSSNYLFWYRQFPSSPPQFLIKEYQKAFQFTFKKEEERNLFHLEISSAVLTDSALYYCAPCSGGSWKVIFGKGTKLVVESKGPEKMPKYYQLGSNGTKACLATDFSSYNRTNGTIGFDNTSEASRAPGEAFYSQVAVNTESGTCGEGNGTCKRGFGPDKEVTSMSFIMLVLRVLFLKAVAFNVLMTLRLWIH